MRGVKMDPKPFLTVSRGSAVVCRGFNPSDPPDKYSPVLLC